MSLNNFFHEKCKEPIRSGEVILKEQDRKGKIVTKQRIKINNIANTIILKLDCEPVNYFFNEKQKMCDYAILVYNESNKTLKAICIELKSFALGDANIQLNMGNRLLEYLIDIYKIDKNSINYNVTFKEIVFIAKIKSGNKLTRKNANSIGKSKYEILYYTNNDNSYNLSKLIVI